MKSYDARLLAIFETEQREHLQRLRTLLDPRGGVLAQRDPRALEEALRRIHTLKGAARAVGIASTETLAHRLESVFIRVRDQALVLDERALAVVHQALNAAEDTLATVLQTSSEPGIGAVLERLDSLPGEPAASAPPPPAEASASAPPPAPDTVRVSARYLDDLVRSSSQLLATRASRTRSARRVDDLCRGLAGAEREWERLRHAARAAFRRAHAEAEWSAVAACLDFADSRLRQLAAQARAAAVLEQRSRFALAQIGTQVHQDACRVLLSPAETVFDGFQKMVRDLARDEGKEVDFRAQGLDVEVDRRVLQALKHPIMHLLRNAVSHGIEAPPERLTAGKPRAGVVRLCLEARGHELEVTVADDGRGLDLRRVAEVAVSQGLLSEAAAASQSAGELSRLVLRSGFSTARLVTRAAGRGLGLAVVQEQVARLHGEVRFGSTVTGTAVVLLVPISISTHHVLLVACAGHTFAVPARAIERLRRIRPEEIESLEGAEVLRVEGRPVPLTRLSALLDLPESAPPHSGNGRPRLLVTILRSAEERLGVIVDALLDEREAVIQDLGLAAQSAGLSLGGVALEDGSVAVVLNVPAILERSRKAAPAPAWKPAPDQKRKAIPNILVVDDSMTTRALEKSILEAHGYQVRLAVDGVEALERLREQPADLVIADLAMPRMDGFELLRRIKADRDLAAIPVIVVTSLETRAEQERGLALGAEAYIVKRKFDQRELLNIVRQVL